MSGPSAECRADRQKWSVVHALATEPTRGEFDARPYPQKLDRREGRQVVETYIVKGMGHGVPLASVKLSLKFDQSESEGGVVCDVTLLGDEGGGGKVPN
jgi:poly(3-hydroxybutyrate) depolymerase